MITWDPWQHLREWVPDVRVVDWDLPSGVQACCSRERRIIWLSSALSPSGRRSCLAYELGVFELGPFDPDHGDEWMAADWAARLLIPFEALRRCCERYDELSDIAASLDVDTATVRARLRGLADGEALLVSADRWLVE